MPIKTRYRNYKVFANLSTHFKTQKLVCTNICCVIVPPTHSFASLFHSSLRFQKSLLTENLTAAGFTLMTSLFVMDWQKTHPDADFVIGQYTLRTLPMWDRRKSVIISDRVHLQSVWTHGFAAKPTFHR